MRTLLLIMAALSFISAPLQSEAANAKSPKELLVLMPIRVPDKVKALTDAMETALVTSHGLLDLASNHTFWNIDTHQDHVTCVRNDFVSVSM